MKKILTYTALVFTMFSCTSGAEQTNQNLMDSSMVQASIIGSVENLLSSSSENDSVKVKINSDTAVYVKKPDSLMSRMNDLIISTDDSHKKITQIKGMKTENQSLKKELKQTKLELKDAKEQIKKLDSVVKVNEKKEKGFFRKVIDNIKGGAKDTINTDTVK